MPTLTIDGRPVAAQDGQTILDAARASAIEIPTLCWYPKLPIVGNCRICLVSVEGQAKLIPACATKVADGMVVTTQSHAAVENRKGVLRLLSERYPAEHLRNGGGGGGGGAAPILATSSNAIWCNTTSCRRPSWIATWRSARATSGPAIR